MGVFFYIVGYHLNTFRVAGNGWGAYVIFSNGAERSKRLEPLI